jgi:hypothetical protein
MQPSAPNYSAERELTWGDGPHVFKLGIKQIGELQKNCNAGLGAIVSRVFSGGYYVEDIAETIRLGLIGGGMAPIEARRMVDAYVDGCPIARAGDPANNLMTAQAILDAAVFGVEEVKFADDKKKDETTETDISTSSTFTDKDSSATSGPSKSDDSLSTNSTPPLPGTRKSTRASPKK